MPSFRLPAVVADAFDGGGSVMYTLGKRYHFEAAHYLPKVPEGHKCRGMHGHNYKIEFYLRSVFLDEAGFVMDFADLDVFVLPFVKQCDHKVLNEIEGLENPTAENIAVWFYRHVHQAMIAAVAAGKIFVDDDPAMLAAVRVYETDEMWVEVK